jgi:hypothetical protein
MLKPKKKTHYINAEEQRQMIRMIAEFFQLTEEGQKESAQAQMIMNRLYSDYIDRIISGVIYNKKYGYHRFAEVEDLMNEGRLAIFESLTKHQWKEWIPKKNNKKEIQYDEEGKPIMVRGASIFSFLSTVAQKNLLSYTFNMNKDRKFRAFQEIETLFDNENMKFNEQHDEKILIPEIFKELKNHFKDRQKLYQLACLLEEYFHKVGGVKFVKKDFIEYAKAHTFSPSLINSFFTYLKNIKSISYIIQK